ncbi:fungal-specific transcription factor domain-containing protein [Geranomyces variabilis]|nr:fungal-specific transcription factor domain-containing protein [Geranomyces variabilis]KAJ3138695.1 hypothetical protein HDU90_001139 [Geranomyces variabilis]
MAGDPPPTISPASSSGYPPVQAPPYEMHIHRQDMPVPTITYHNVPLKRSRSTRACDTCRRKRTKCTGGQPCEGCMSFGLPCLYTAPIKKRGPAKRPAPTAGAATATATANSAHSTSSTASIAQQSKTQTTLGQRLKTVESLLSGLIHGAPIAMPPDASGSRPRASSEASLPAGSRSASAGTQEVYTDDDDDEYETEDEAMEVEESGGFNGIALAVHRPRGRAVDPTDGSLTEGEVAPTFCQVPWRQGVTVTDPESGVLVRKLSLNDPSVIAHRFNNNAGNITIVEDVVTDTVLFYGSTVTSNTSAFRQSPRFADGIMSIALRSDVQPANPSISHDSPPCSPDLVHHLVSLYFTHIHPYFPMIDRKSFTRQLKENQTEHFSLLLNSMCALVTQQTRSLHAWGISSTAELHRAFFERARALLGKQFDWPHINNVQALLLLTLVGAGTNTNAASYQYIGIAHRHAVELGMHRNLERLNHPGLDDAMKEQMRATWFCLYILDRYIGVHQGRPFAINDDDWDTPLPRQEETGDVSRMIRHVALCSILGQIANYVNRPSGRRRTRASRDQWVREMDEELCSWRSLLPPDLQAEPTRDPGSWSFHHHLHAMYHTAVILLYRIATGRFGGVCVASAVAIRKVLEALPNSPGMQSLGVAQPDYVFVMPIVVYSGLTAATMFLDMVLEPHVGPGGRRSSHGNRRKRSKSGEDGIKAELAAGQRRVDAAQELRRSLVAFEKLKEVSQFSVYYGQLIAECMKGAGLAMKAGANGASGDSSTQARNAAAASSSMPSSASAGSSSAPTAGGQHDGMPRIDKLVLIPDNAAAVAGRPPYLYNGTTPSVGPGAFSFAPQPGLQVQTATSGDHLGYVPQHQHQQHQHQQQQPTHSGGGQFAPNNSNPTPIFSRPPPPGSGPQQHHNPALPPGPYFADSIFSELLNPFFDPEATWWGDFGLDAAGAGAPGSAGPGSASSVGSSSASLNAESLNRHHGPPLSGGVPGVHAHLHSQQQQQQQQQQQHQQQSQQPSEGGSYYSMSASPPPMGPPSGSSPA